MTMREPHGRAELRMAVNQAYGHENIIVKARPFASTADVWLGHTIKDADTLRRLGRRSTSAQVSHFRLKNVVLDPVSGCLFQGNQIVENTSCHLYNGEYESACLRSKSITNSIRGRRVFSAFHRWAPYNYGHWIVQVLPTIYHFLCEDDFQSSILLMPKVKFQSQKDSLSAIAEFLPEIKFVDEAEVLFMEDVTVSSIIYDDIWESKFVNTSNRRFFRKFADPYENIFKELSFKNRPMIYYSRQNFPARRMINEESLIANLERFGIQPIFCEEMSFHDQVDIFNSASVVIGAHGAGMMNTVFCQKSSIIYELFPEHFVPGLVSRIAQEGGIHYWADTFAVEDKFINKGNDHKIDEIIRRRNVNWAVDIDVIQDRVTNILNRYFQ